MKTANIPVYVLTETPWGTVPVIKIDGREYGQTNAIARHISHFTGTAAACPKDAAYLDEVAEVGSEFFHKFIPYFGATDETMKVRTIAA